MQSVNQFTNHSGNLSINQSTVYQSIGLLIDQSINQTTYELI